jgi:hypothetical protein
MAKVLEVSAAANKLLEGSATDPFPPAILSAVLSGSSIASAIVQTRDNTVTARVNDYYDIGLADKRIGAPVGVNFSVEDATEQARIPIVRDIIAASLGTTAANIVIMSLEIGYANPDLLMKITLQNSEYASSNWQIYNEGYYYNTSSAARFGADGVIHTTLSPSAGEDAGDLPADLTFTHSADQNAIYHHVMYYSKVNGASNPITDRQIWAYKNNSILTGDYIDLNIDTSLLLGGEYLPVAPIRSSKQWIGSDLPSYWGGAQAIVDRMLAPFGLTYGSIKTAVIDSIESDPNSEIAVSDVDDVVALFAMDVSDSSDLSNRLLYQTFFSYFYSISGPSQSDWFAWLNETGAYAGQDHNTNNRPRNKVEIKSPSLTMTFEYQWSTLKIYTGNPSTDGEHSPTSIITSEVFTTVQNEPVPGIGEVVRKEYGFSAEDEETSQSGVYRTDRLVFRKPLSTDAGKYIEIVLYGVRTIYDVHTMGSNSKGFFEIGTPEWGNVPMLHPVSRDIPALFDQKTESDMYYMTFYLVTYVYKFRDLSFFEGALFGFLFLVFQLVVAILTLGSSQAFIEAAKAGAKELIKYFLIRALVGIAIGYIATQVISLVGMEVGLILAVAVIALSLYNGYGGGKDFLSYFQPENLLYNVSIATNATNNVIADKFMELEDKSQNLDDLMRTSEAQQEDTERYYESIKGVDPNLVNFSSRSVANNAHLDPTVVIDNAIHNPNPGLISIQVPSLFVELTMNRLQNHRIYSNVA